MDNSRVKATIFFIEKISFSLKLFSGHFYGQSFIKTVRGPLMLCHYNVDILNICLKEFDLMLCHYNVDILNICMKEFDLEIIISDKMTAVRT